MLFTFCLETFVVLLFAFIFLAVVTIVSSLASLLLFSMHYLHTHQHTKTHTQGLWLQLAKGGLGLRYQFDARHSPQNFTLTLTPVVKYV